MNKNDKRIYRDYTNGCVSFSETLNIVFNSFDPSSFFSSDRRSLEYKAFKKYSTDINNLHEVYEKTAEFCHNNTSLAEPTLKSLLKHSELLTAFLENKICSFKEFVSLFADSNNLLSLIENFEIWKDLKRLKTISLSDIEYIVDVISDSDELTNFLKNDHLFDIYLSSICEEGSIFSSKQKFQVFLKKLGDFGCLDYLFLNSTLNSHLRGLTKNTENLKFFVDLLFQLSNEANKDSFYPLLSFVDFRYLNSKVIFEASVQQRILTNEKLQKIFERLTHIDHSERTVRLAKDFLNVFLNNAELSSDSIRAYFNSLKNSLSIAKAFDLSYVQTDMLSLNILKEFFVNQNQILSKAEIDRLNEDFLFEQPLFLRNLILKHRNVLDCVLDNENLGKYMHIDESANIQKLHEKIHRNKEMYDFGLLSFVQFNDEQLLKLYDCINSSESSKNILKQIVDSNLQDQYTDFDALFEIFSKNDKKMKNRFNL